MKLIRSKLALLILAVATAGCGMYHGAKTTDVAECNCASECACGHCQGNEGECTCGQ